MKKQVTIPLTAELSFDPTANTKLFTLAPEIEMRIPAFWLSYWTAYYSTDPTTLHVYRGADIIKTGDVTDDFVHTLDEIFIPYVKEIMAENPAIFSAVTKITFENIVIQNKVSVDL